MKTLNLEVPPNFIWPHLLLHPNIPKPLHGLNPRTLLGQEWWDVRRKQAYETNNFCCWACGIHKSKALYHNWLEAHECYLIDYQKGRAEMKLIVALCHACHNFIHSGRMMNLVAVGKMSQGFMTSVIKHGSEIKERSFRLNWPKEISFLQKTIRSSELAGVKIAEWSKWRLRLDGKEYKPLHKDYDTWYNFYQQENDAGGD